VSILWEQGKHATIISHSFYGLKIVVEDKLMLIYTTTTEEEE